MQDVACVSGFRVDNTYVSHIDTRRVTFACYLIAHCGASVNEAMWHVSTMWLHCLLSGKVGVTSGLESPVGIVKRMRRWRGSLRPSCTVVFLSLWKQWHHCRALRNSCAFSSEPRSHLSDLLPTPFAAAPNSLPLSNICVFEQSLTTSVISFCLRLCIFALCSTIIRFALEWLFPVLFLLFEKAPICIDEGRLALQTFACKLWIIDEK